MHLPGQTFHPPLLRNIQASLYTPASRIPQHLLDTEPVGASSYLQRNDVDLCSTHKLVADAGKLVNLGDWHGAFELHARESIEDHRVELPTTPSKRAKSGSVTRGRKENGVHVEEAEAAVSLDTQIDARFLAAVADLAFLGHIQPTKRKAEHVARIVF